MTDARLRSAIVRRVNAKTMQALATILEGNPADFAEFRHAGFFGDLWAPQTRRADAATHDGRWVKFSRVSMLPKRGLRFLTIPRDFFALIRFEHVQYRTFGTGIFEYSTLNVASRIKMLGSVIQLCAAYFRPRSARLFRTLTRVAMPNTIRDSQLRCNKVGRDVKFGLTAAAIVNCSAGCMPWLRRKER